MYRIMLYKKILYRKSCTENKVQELTYRNIVQGNAVQVIRTGQQMHRKYYTQNMLPENVVQVLSYKKRLYMKYCTRKLCTGLVLQKRLYRKVLYRKILNREMMYRNKWPPTRRMLHDVIILVHFRIS